MLEWHRHAWLLLDYPNKTSPSCPTSTALCSKVVQEWRQGPMTAYWPGLNKKIHAYSDRCTTCVQHVYSTLWVSSKKPIIISPSPEWLFQMITGDYFTIAGHHYLSIVDCYNGWIGVYHFGHQRNSCIHLQIIFHHIWCTWGIQLWWRATIDLYRFSKISFNLDIWLSSIWLSTIQWPCRICVKAAKRLLYNNISVRGSIDNDKARVTLQYRNTPLPDLNPRPAQILFQRKLRDHVPAHLSHYYFHSPLDIIRSTTRRSIQ